MICLNENNIKLYNFTLILDCLAVNWLNPSVMELKIC